MSKALVLGAAALLLSAASASAQIYATPDYGYEPVADLAVPADGYAAPAAPPAYAAPPVYAAPAPPVYVVPAPVYVAPLVPRYYAAPVVLPPPRGFAANICLRPRLLGWLRAWVARLRSPVVMGGSALRQPQPATPFVPGWRT